MAPPPSNASQAEKFKHIIDNLQDYSNFKLEAGKNTTDIEEPAIEKLNIKDETNDDKVDALVNAFLDIGGFEILQRAPREAKKKDKKLDSQDAGPSS